MRIAVPMLQSRFCSHFGRSDGFFLCDVEGGTRISQPRALPRPTPVKCESLPGWLKRLGVTHVFAGAIGAVARHELEQSGIEVRLGCDGAEPAAIVRDVLPRGPHGGSNQCRQFKHDIQHCRQAPARATRSE